MILARDVPARPVHGGDLSVLAERRGVGPQDLLDFSSNVNPHGPPRRVRRFLVRAARDPALVRRYPDDTHLKLRSTLGRHWRIPAEAIVIANGTSALLHEIVRLLRPRTCVLPVPAFSEYGHALRMAGTREIPFPLRAERSFRLDVAEFARAIHRHRPALAIVNSPHNPSGVLVPPRDIDSLLEAARRTGTLLLLDEAFIDFASPGSSRVRLAAAGAPLLVLRSLTKLYGMAGVRVGCAIAEPALALRLLSALPSWPVGALAAGAALEALRDIDFATRSRKQNAAARRRLARDLASLGCFVFPSAANFLLVRLPAGAPSARRVQERLATRWRLLVRDVSTYAGLEEGGVLRVAVRRPAENARLVRALRSLLTDFATC
jgi:threonine-phosphate decarboxylase